MHDPEPAIYDFNSFNKHGIYFDYNLRFNDFVVYRIDKVYVLFNKDGVGLDDLLTDNNRIMCMHRLPNGVCLRLYYCNGGLFHPYRVVQYAVDKYLFSTYATGHQRHSKEQYREEFGGHVEGA